MFVGVDGCRAGWFAIALTKGSMWQVNTFPDVASLWAHYNQASMILIDIPIGLREEGVQERRCDPVARKLLGPRRSSVFPAPCRSAAYAESYREACEVNEKLTGRRLSMESWNITPKIREVDCLLSNDEAARARIREIHPELCFCGLAAHPMRHPKKRPEGLAERTRILQSIYPPTAAVIKHTISAYRRKDVSRDDILDALCTALTAMLGEQKLTSIPQPSEFDSRGLRMEMVYYSDNP
jgi:predicted RNase H-like nuclease